MRHKIRVWVFLTEFWLNDVTTSDQRPKRPAFLTFLITFDNDLLITSDTYTSKIDPFYPVLRCQEVDRYFKIWNMNHKTVSATLRMVGAVVRRSSVNYTQRKSSVGVIEKKVFLEIWQNSQENNCARTSVLITFQKNRLWHRCFPVNFEKFSRTNFFIEYFWCLLLECICIEV